MSFLKTPIFKFLLSVVLLVSLGWFVSSQEGLSKEAMMKALEKFNTTTIAWALFWVCLQNFFMALRIWCLFPTNHRVKFFWVIHTIFLGQTLNTFVPARAGDLYKAVAFSKHPLSGQTISPLTAAGVLVSDKLVDIFALITLILVSGAFSSAELPFAGQVPRSVFIGIPLVFVASSFLIRGIWKSKWEQVKSWWSKFKMGLGGVFEPHKAFFALLIGVGAWSCEALTLQVLCSSQEFTITFSQAVFVLSVLNLMIAVPLSFANLGPFEASIVFAMEKLGTTSVIGLAVAAAHHALQMIGLLLLTAVIWILRFLISNDTSQADDFRVQQKDKETAIKYFDRVSKQYDETVSKGILKIPRERERAAVLNFASLNQSGASLIDVGCGAGFYSLIAKKAGMKVHAVDMSPGMVQKLQGLVDSTEVADVETISTKTQYDRVICAGVLDFVLEPQKAFSNLCKLVAPGGKLIVLCPRKGPGGLFYRVEKKCFGIKINLYTKEWLSNLAEQNGLRLVDFSYPLPTNMALLFTNN